MMSRCMRRKAKREVCADLVSVLQEDDDIPKEPSERDLGTQKSCPSRSCGGSNKIVFLLCFITNVEFLVHEDGEHMMNDNEGYQAK
ncbi:ENTH domain [Musa troglodytarum]|uniref:ENTH domain n=1 Tax=Musa troglodytarum TaxID=320322 RepID=A0A9E7G555_9LILI|nr:ENTH domain [Musa troglodytarum]